MHESMVNNEVPMTRESFNLNARRKLASGRCDGPSDAILVRAGVAILLDRRDFISRCWPSTNTEKG